MSRELEKMRAELEALVNQGAPRFAVVRLKPEDDPNKLLRLLLDNGYADLSLDCGGPKAISQLEGKESRSDSSGVEVDSTSDDSDSNRDRSTSNYGSDAQSRQSPAEKEEPAWPRDGDVEPEGRLYPFRTHPVLPLVPQDTIRHLGAEAVLRESSVTPPYALHPPPPSLSDFLMPRFRIGPQFAPSPVYPVPRIPKPLTTAATTQLRQRGSRAQSDDPSIFVACKLCQNKIMASRLSNLTNHVRRHSALKQFQCCYCDYTHNEMAKVRLHMLHNHKDKDSQPIDNLSPEMQTSWEILMQQCFPDHYQQSHPKPERPLRPEPARGAVGCAECGEMVLPTERLDHVHRSHLNCSPFVCSVCASESHDRGSLLVHIAVKHPGTASARVFTRDTLTIAEALIPKYFPHHLPALPTPPTQEAVLEPPPPLPPVFGLASSGLAPAFEREMLKSAGGKEDLKCLLCRKVLEGMRPLSSLLNHAKRHYHLKQFKCVHCSYSSSEAAHVRSHMKLKHSNADGKDPIDNRNTSLQTAWVQTMVRCFPSVASRLKKFRFKNFRNKPSGRPKRNKNPVVVPIPEENPSPQLIDVCAEDNSAVCVPVIRSSAVSEHTTEEGEEESEAEEKKVCRLCGVACLSKEEQIGHIATHVPLLKPFRCSICQFSSREYQALRAHLWKHKLIGGDRHKAQLREGMAEMGELSGRYFSYCFGGPKPC